MTNSLVDRLAKKFGDFFIITDEEGDEIDVISTGSLSLDVSVGVGGIPKGRITTIYGAEGVGKTTLCLEIVKQALDKGEKVVYVDLEHSLDFTTVRAIVGEFDIKNFLMVQPDTAEDALNLVEMFINGDTKFEIIPGEFSLIIIDSVAALAPKREKEKELEDRNVALQSGLLTPFFRRNIHNIKKNKIALVFVNQVRDNIGAYHGGYILPGGHALKHYSSLLIFLSAGQKYIQDGYSIGMDCKFITKKNKLSPPFREYTMPLIFGKGIDFYRDAIDFAFMLRVIKKKGTWYFFEEEQMGQGMDQTKEYLKDHPETLDKIKKGCYDSVKRYQKVVEEEDEWTGLLE